MPTLRGLDFDTHFRDQYPGLVRELDYILGDTALARDVVQDAFIKQFASWARLQHFDKPGAWVRRVAIRLGFQARRKLSRNVPLDAVGDIADQSESNSERNADVSKALGKLPDQQRAAIVLHYYRDLPVVEVAKALGCKESTAKVHLFKGRQTLAELLIDYRP